MDSTRIILSGLWVATMLTYLLGDVLRIFSGDFESAKIAGGVEPTQAMWLLIAAIMLIPIVMVVLTVTVMLDVNDDVVLVFEPAAAVPES